MFGKKALETLLSLPFELKKEYILMERVRSSLVENILMEDSKYRQVKCEYEVSRYGVFSYIQANIVDDKGAGYLVRVKPEQ